VTYTIDVNPLVYASDATSPLQPRAAQLLSSAASGDEVVYLFWPVVMGYLRIVTSPRILDSPLPHELAMANVDLLLGLPNVLVGGERDGFFATYREVGHEVTARGKLVADAHIVALMRQYGVTTIYTHDRDFRKFDGLRVVDPFGSPRG
jgi:uncharacterized protein